MPMGALEATVEAASIHSKNETRMRELESQLQRAASEHRLQQEEMKSELLVAHRSAEEARQVAETDVVVILTV